VAYGLKNNPMESEADLSTAEEGRFGLAFNSKINKRSHKRIENKFKYLKFMEILL